VSLCERQATFALFPATFTAYSFEAGRNIFYARNSEALSSYLLCRELGNLEKNLKKTSSSIESFMSEHITLIARKED
jgi:hypothetical protein